MEETIVSLKVLSADQTPDMITKSIGLQCDRSWRIGDTRPHTIIKEESHGWVLGSRMPEAADLGDHINVLLALLESRAEAIKAMSATCIVEISCVIYANAAPALNFDKSVVDKLARLGASLDIDLYILEKDSGD